VSFSVVYLDSLTGWSSQRSDQAVWTYNSMLYALPDTTKNTLLLFNKAFYQSVPIENERAPLLSLFVPCEVGDQEHTLTYLQNNLTAVERAVSVNLSTEDARKMLRGESRQEPTVVEIVDDAPRPLHFLYAMDLLTEEVFTHATRHNLGYKLLTVPETEAPCILAIEFTALDADSGDVIVDPDAAKAVYEDFLRHTKDIGQEYDRLLKSVLSTGSDK